MDETKTKKMSFNPDWCQMVGAIIINNEVIGLKDEGIVLSDIKPCPSGMIPHEYVLGVLLYSRLKNAPISDLFTHCVQTAVFLLAHFDIVKK